MYICLKLLSGMANSVDPDQTAPLEQFDLCLDYLHISCYKKNEILGHLL